MTDRATTLRYILDYRQRQRLLRRPKGPDALHRPRPQVPAAVATPAHTPTKRHSTPTPSTTDNDESPENLARLMKIPLQRVLFDFGIHSPERQVLGGMLIDLSTVVTEDVRSMINDQTMITIAAHKGDGQKVADLLYQHPDLITLAVSYAQSYRNESGRPIDCALYALSSEEMRNIERNTGHNLPPTPND